MTDTLPQPRTQPHPDAAMAVNPAAPDAVAEARLVTQSPQRRITSQTFTVEIDGRQVTGREGQTILEVCRDNGVEVPTLCYEPKLPGFGACRMCVVEVDGEGHAADQLLARGRARRWSCARRRRACARSARPTSS